MVADTREASEPSGDERPQRWHCLSTGAVLARLDVDATRGLDEREVLARRRRDGINDIEVEAQRSLIAVVASQLTDFMIVVLIAAAVVSGVLGELSDTIAIIVIVVLNAGVGAAHEYRAQRAIAALRRLAPQRAKVMRDGRSREIEMRDLVPGDIVALAAGDVVPADLRLLEVTELQIDESALTGESMPVDKHARPLEGAELPLGDRANLAYRSTAVTEGRGSGVVVATGPRTEIGRIAALLTADEDQRTPLQRRLAVFGRRLALVALVICALVFVLGVARGGDPLLLFLTAVSLAVAAIPEALPAVVTVALALGAKQLGHSQCLVRRLPAVEALGSVTYICTDKTGTLTENRMVVAGLRVGATDYPRLGAVESPVLRERLGRVLALCNVLDAADPSLATSTGGGTEQALYREAWQAGFVKAAELAALPLLAELAFNSERKRMTTIHSSGAGTLALMKGAPESVIGTCVAEHAPTGQIVPLDAPGAAASAGELAGSGYRVLALAWRESGVSTVPQDDTSGFTLLGFVALSDPIRAEVPEAVRECTLAGVVPIMMTGDHPETARDIATRLGLLRGKERLVTGAELARMSAAECAARVRDVRVYARVDPLQKIDIVRALQQAGELVAMTGDGVNDAPALKQASIGIAMGRRGTDVARESADIVLLDDNFSTIVAAIREGRHVYDNIRKFVRYTMSSNLGEVLVLIVLPFLGYPIPLLPIHILWINLVTDGLPGLAFSAEPAESGIMRRPPRSPTESVFGDGLWQQMLVMGITIGTLGCIAAFAVSSIETAALHTMVFTTVVVSQLLHALSVRTERDSLRKAGLFSNPYLLVAIALGIAAQLAIVYVPLFNAWFDTTALPAADLAMCLGLSVVAFAIAEAQKLLVGRWRSASV